jgi:DNA-binding transcriptional ArsR family regulator
MEQLAVLADPTRRRIVELLAAGDRSAGELAAGFAISQPAVSRHLRSLREAGLVRVRPLAQQRIYSLELEPLQDLEQWILETRAMWESRLDALGAEIVRAREPRKERRDDIR